LLSFSGREFSRNTSAADGRRKEEKGIGALPTTAFRGIKLLLIRDCRMVRDSYTASTIMV